MQQDHRRVMTGRQVAQSDAVDLRISENDRFVRRVASPVVGVEEEKRLSAANSLKARFTNAP